MSACELALQSQFIHLRVDGLGYESLLLGFLVVGGRPSFRYGGLYIQQRQARFVGECVHEDLLEDCLHLTDDQHPALLENTTAIVGVQGVQEQTRQPWLIETPPVLPGLQLLEVPVVVDSLLKLLEELWVSLLLRFCNCGSIVTW